MVGSQHERADQHEKTSVPALGCRGAACIAVERLSFGLQRFTSFQIDETKVASGGHLVVSGLASVRSAVGVTNVVGRGGRPERTRLNGVFPVVCCFWELYAYVSGCQSRS